jgi:hypothetical protein
MQGFDGARLEAEVRTGAEMQTWQIEKFTPFSTLQVSEVLPITFAQQMHG